MDNSKEMDLILLSSLYYGNHLNNDELEKAKTLLYLLNTELKGRVN